MNGQLLKKLILQLDLRKNKNFLTILIIIGCVFLTFNDKVSTLDQNLHVSNIALNKKVTYTSLRNIGSETFISSSINIDFNNVVKVLSPLAIGGVNESGYGTPNVLVNDPTQQQNLKKLRISYMRMDLKYTKAGDPNSKIICGGLGCDTRWSGDEWINSIKALGAEPVVEDAVNPYDLPNLVKHFNKDTNNHVSRWLNGINEPDLNDQDASTYSNKFNESYDAMKAIDPTIKIGGPNVAWYDVPFIQSFLYMSGSRVDFIDFHGYAEGLNPMPYSTLFFKAATFESDINDLYQRIQKTIPNRAGQIEIQVGEWDLDYEGHALEYTPFNTVWGASVIGHIIKAGGIGLLYADKGNLLLSNGGEITNRKIDDRTPMYHALGMFTGESLFPKFGTNLVMATTTLPNIEVYASDLPKNIVVINKDPNTTQKAVFFLNNVQSGTVSVWRKDLQSSLVDNPNNLGNQQIVNGFFTFDLLPFSVTTFIITNTSSNIDNKVESFTLSDSLKNPISGYAPISNGAIISLKNFSQINLNIKANVSPTKVGSVVFGLDQNSIYHIENYNDYFLGGKEKNGWVPTIGIHTITATPYTNAKGKGKAGKSMSITINIIP